MSYSLILHFLETTAAFWETHLIYGTGCKAVATGVGICFSYTIFSYKFLSENITLILVSVITSLALILRMSTYIFHDEVLVLFMLWQGAMMGCLAYFTLKKLQKENNLIKN
ncbi:MAG: hypothetical protein IPL31_05810 [Saprospiraceae bacterium]|nr:hypothetical protein [Saprospiraceae bacterium]